MKTTFSTYLNNFKYNKFNASINEWRNSIYSFNKFNLNTYLNEKILGKILNYYFNLNNKNSIYSLKRIYVGISDVKHSIKDIVINVYIFNKEKYFYLKRINKLNKIKNKTNLNLKTTNLTNNNFINSSLFNGLKINLYKNIYSKFLYKLYISKLYINNFKLNIININNLNNILSKLYNKKIVFNITNLKYIYLDNSLFIDAIIRKLKDRNRKVLRVLRKSIILSKIPKINPLLLIKVDRKKEKHENKSIFTYNNIIISSIKNINVSIFKHLKNLHVIGIRLEGKGRLTKRLTASRSVHKSTYIGTLNNIYSSFQGRSSLLSKGFQSSTTDYINVNHYNRNGSYGIKSYNNTF